MTRHIKSALEKAIVERGTLTDEILGVLIEATEEQTDAIRAQNENLRAIALNLARLAKQAKWEE